MQLIPKSMTFFTAVGINGGTPSIFDEWNQGVLRSYLIEITAEDLQTPG